MAYFGTYLRRTAFWAADSLRKPSICSQVLDIEGMLSGGLQTAVLQSERLTQLLSHATRTTQFYRPYAGSTELQAFPVIEKRTISENPGAFQSSSYEGQDLPVMSTSGSMGMPMQFRLSHLKRRRQQAEIIHFSRIAGFRLGSRHANVRIIRNKSNLRYWMENQVLLDPSVVDQEWLARARLELRHPELTFLTGYARPISMLADYCRQKADSPALFSLKAVVPTAERLAADERQNIESVFGCPVIDRYATQEFGVLAQECLAGRRLHLNIASYMVEVLSLQEDSLAAPSELGRVVVTDLFSHAMPLIRYDTGDLAALDTSSCNCGNPSPSLSQLEGRLVEMILDTRGRLISPFVLVNNLREVQGIRQFRFIQKTLNSYELLLESNIRPTEEQRLKALLVQYLGELARIEIKLVKGIPPLRSGKRPYVVNEYLKGDSIGSAAPT
jgi:phenylacetate-CoA ligase